MVVISEVLLSEAIANNRFSAEFFDPRLMFTPKVGSAWEPIGRVLDRYDYGLSIAMNTSGIGHPMFRMNELGDCLALRPQKWADIPAAVFNRSALKAGDVLFNRTNSFEFVGRTSLITDQTDCTFASYLVRLVPDKTRLLPEYLTIYLNTPFGIGQVKRRAMRSINQANVSASEVRRVLILLPDIATQEEVAGLVQSAEARLRLSIKLYDDAQRLFDSELDVAVQGTTPSPWYITSLREVTAARRMDADYFQPKYEAIRAAVLGYPNGHVRLVDVCESLRPNITPAAHPLESFDYIELSDINPVLGTVDDSTSRRGGDLPSRAKRQVRAGDVLASTVVGSVDKAALVDVVQNDFVASTGFFHLRTKGVLSEYLLILVRSLCVRAQFQQQSTGGILSAVPDARLQDVIVPDLPTDLQTQIAGLVRDSHAAASESKELLAEAKSYVQHLVEESLAT